MLKDMSDEERAVDTILKHNKLGPLYSIGLSKGIKQYDPNNFDHEKIAAERLYEIESKIKKTKNSGNVVSDVDIDEVIEGENVEREIDMEDGEMPSYDVNYTDDNDPWDEMDRDYD